MFCFKTGKDKWEVFGNGALRNIGDDRCLGVYFASIDARAERLSCPTEATPLTPERIWGDVVAPPSSEDGARFRYQHCAGFDFGSCVPATADADPSTISNDFGFLREGLGLGRDALGLEEWDSQLVPTNGVWDFEVAECPATGTLAAEARGPSPRTTCYLIVNRHSGNLLFATSEGEGGEGVGAAPGGGTVSDDRKWTVAKDPSCAGRSCFEIVNARSGRKLRSLGNMYSLPNFGADAVVSGNDGGDAGRWRIAQDQLYLEDQKGMAAIEDNQTISCRPDSAVLAAFKMQATADYASHAFGCDDSFLAGGTGPATRSRVAASSLIDGAWGCTEPGEVLSGISSERDVDDVWLRRSTCVDAGADTNVCEDRATDYVSLYDERGRRSPNPVAHLSRLPVACGVGQALRSVDLENHGGSIRYAYRCCEVLRDEPGSGGPGRAALDRLTAATNAVSACGARHAWILPEQINEDNAQYDPAKFSDRVGVLLDRLHSVIVGIDDGFRLGEVTEALREGHARVAAAFTVAEAVAAAQGVEETVSLRCPSEPVFRWKKAASGTAIETELEFGLTSEWSEGDFEEFVKGVTESRGELHGQEVSSGSESTTGSSKTITDTFSVTATVGADYLFASASLELGYERSEEKSSYQEETLSSSETQSVELTKDLTQEVSNALGREVITTSSISETRTCTATCESDDDYQVIIWQWVYEQTDPNAKDATVHTCTFVCRSAVFGNQPVCPGGQCLNNDCTVCSRGTFADPDVDRFYSTERIANLSTKDTTVKSTSPPSPGDMKGDSETSIENSTRTDGSLRGESSAALMLSISSSFLGILAVAAVKHLILF